METLAGAARRVLPHPWAVLRERQRSTGVLNSKRPFRRAVRALYLALASLATGVLPNHLSCTRIVQDSLGNGTSTFLTNTTADLLSTLFLPDWLRNGTPDATGSTGSDPFAPPVQS